MGTDEREVWEGTNESQMGWRQVRERWGEGGGRVREGWSETDEKRKWLSETDRENGRDKDG